MCASCNTAPAKYVSCPWCVVAGRVVVVAWLVGLAAGPVLSRSPEDLTHERSGAPDLAAIASPAVVGASRRTMRRCTEVSSVHGGGRTSGELRPWNGRGRRLRGVRRHVAQLVPVPRSHLPRRLPGRQAGGWAGRQPPGRRRLLLRVFEAVALGGGVQGPPSEAPAGSGPAVRPWLHPARPSLVVALSAVRRS